MVIIIIVFISNMNMIIINISLETQEISGFSENMTAEMDSGIHKVFSFSGIEENQVKNNSIHYQFYYTVGPNKNCGIGIRNLSNS